MRKVLVTGLGVISPVGNGRDEFFRNLLAGKSGIRRLSADFMPRLAAKIGGEVDFDAAALFPKPKLALLDRFSQFALAAAQQAFSDARIDAGDPRKDMAGVYLGTGQGAANSTEGALQSAHMFPTAEGLSPWSANGPRRAG